MAAKPRALTPFPFGLAGQFSTDLTFLNPKKGKKADDSKLLKACSLLFDKALHDSTVLTEAFSSKYVINKMLGLGAFGVVLDGHSESDHVAIKVSKAIDFNKFLVDEARLAALIHERDPAHTLRVLEANTVRFPLPCSSMPGRSRIEPRAYMVTEFGGMNVYDAFLHPNAPYSMDLRNFTHYCYQCLLFWRNIKEYVLHDLKPENQLVNSIDLTKPGSVKFIDLQNSGKIGEKETTHYIGSRFYRSPEILTKTFGSSEVPFALGAIFAELVTGKAVFESKLSDREHLVIRMQRHLYEVFSFFGLPKREILVRIPQQTFDKYFKIVPSKSSPGKQDCQFFTNFKIPSAPKEDPRVRLQREIQVGLEKRIGYKEPNHSEVAAQVFDLIQKMLDYNNPPTAEEILMHPFFDPFREELAVHDKSPEITGADAATVVHEHAERVS